MRMGCDERTRNPIALFSCLHVLTHTHTHSLDLCCRKNLLNAARTTKPVQIFPRIFYLATKKMRQRNNNKIRPTERYITNCVMITNSSLAQSIHFLIAVNLFRIPLSVFLGAIHVNQVTNIDVRCMQIVKVNERHNNNNNNQAAVMNYTIETHLVSSVIDLFLYAEQCGVRKICRKCRI